MPTEQKCRGCGMKIEFIRGPSGKMIPAQKIKTVYFGVIDLAGEWTLSRGEAYSDEAMYVSHFETCPKADDFSGSKGTG